MIIKKLTLALLVASLTLNLSGCSIFKPDTMYIEPPKVTVYSPETPTNPKDPGVRPTIITVDRLEKREIPDVAYVGFKYNEWLEFAKWLHKYRSVQLELREIITGYEDIYNDSTDVDSTERTGELTE
jgi:hypothetical protein